MALTKLEQAVNKQAKELDPAQKEFVLAEFETYKWNADKIKDLEVRLKDERDPDLEKKIAGVRHQLVNENASLFSHIMRWLKDTAVETSELDEFLA